MTQEAQVGDPVAGDDVVASTRPLKRKIVHPTARTAFNGGDQVVQDRLDEERAAKETLSRLDDMDADDRKFMPILLSLRGDVLKHAGAEERYEFAHLRRATSPQRLAMLAKAVKAVEKMAPTHPHPGVESATKNIAAAPVAAPMDRTRDAIRNAMNGDT